MVFTYDWAVTDNPADHSKFKDQPSFVRKVRTDLEERLAAILYGFTTGETTGGFKYANFRNQAGDPSAQADGVVLFSKDVSAASELHIRHESAGIIALTSLGKILASVLTIASEARGDMIVRGASVWGRVAIGASRKIWISDGTDPSWQSLVAADLTALILTPNEYTDVEDSTTADESTTNASYQDTALSLTFTVGKQGLVFASFDAGGHSDSGVGKWAIVVDGVVKKEIAHNAGAGDSVHPLSLSWHGVLSAAAHTIKVQIKNDGGGGATHIKGATSTARLNVSHPT